MILKGLGQAAEAVREGQRLSPNLPRPGASRPTSRRASTSGATRSPSRSTRTWSSATAVGSWTSASWARCGPGRRATTRTRWWPRCRTGTGGSGATTSRSPRSRCGATGR
jgi:hypothetical protein